MKERESKLLSILNANWRTEMEGHYTYKALSDKERDSQRAMLCAPGLVRKSITQTCRPNTFMHLAELLHDK